MPTWIDEEPLPRAGLNFRAAAALRCGLGRLLFPIGVLVAFLPAPPVARAQSRPSEYDVKAAYLFRFGKFMRIAGAPGPPNHDIFEICILGRDPIGHVLDDITANESIDKRAVRVMRVSDAFAARGCDVAFISAEEGEGIAADLAALGKADVLTVSDAPDFLKRGGMIQFVTQGDHVRFSVNLDAVGGTHLV